MARRLLMVCLALLAMGSFAADCVAAAPKKLLLVTTTLGWRHSSIETAERVIGELGRASGDYAVELAAVTPPGSSGITDQRAYAERVKAVLAEKMNPAALKRYDAVVFANTTGELPLPDKDAFIQWIRDGGAFVGIHSASDTLHEYRPYIEMLGGEFDYHREQVVVEAVNRDALHPATRHLGASWNLEGRREEIYVLKNVQHAAVHELLVLERHPNTREPGHHALSWCREFGRGRVFYTALGHNEDVWEMPAFQQHVLGGIQWVLGGAQRSAETSAR